LAAPALAHSSSVGWLDPELATAPTISPAE
jgi:hypothetical protein